MAKPNITVEAFNKALFAIQWFRSDKKFGKLKELDQGLIHLVQQLPIANGGTTGSDVSATVDGQPLNPSQAIFRARELLGNPDEKSQNEMFNRLNKLGLKVDKLDDVLLLNLSSVLSRRLQTVVYKKGLAKTLKESRQLIAHRHVMVDKKKIWYPSYLVPAEKEASVELDDTMRNQKLSNPESV